MKKIVNITLLLFFVGLRQGICQMFVAEGQLVTTLQSPYDESNLTVSPDGQNLLFSLSRHPSNLGGIRDLGDIWKSTKDSVWRTPTNWAVVNDAEISSPIGFSPDGSTFYFNNIQYKSGMLKTEIWAMQKDKKIQQKCKYFKNKSLFQSACISYDNRYMVVSMEGVNTRGVEDLYVIEKIAENEWSAPKNLGTVLNTSFQEITPFLSADNKKLFFASNGHLGKGGFDIFMTERLDDTWRSWSEPINLGEKINTSGNETSFVTIPNSQIAYYISTQDSHGYGDIKWIEMIQPFGDSTSLPKRVVFEEKPQTEKKGFYIFNSKTNQPISKKIILLSENNTQTFWAEKSGFVAVSQPIEGVIEVDGFMEMDVKIETDSIQIIKLAPLEIGQTINLKNVLFTRGTDNLLPSSFHELTLLVKMLEKNPQINIFLKGHTDTKGNPEENLELSQKRVEKVKAFLTKNGIKKNRIKGKGYGGTQPIAEEYNEEMSQKNRRVEFEIIK